MTGDPILLARKHAMLRYATGITLAFVLAEAMGWNPTCLPPILLGLLLSSLPFSPPFKLGAVLVAVMTAAATLAYAIPYLLRGTPTVMVGAIGLFVFLAFLAYAMQVARLPALLLLICLTTIPVVVMIVPQQAGSLRLAMGRSITIAVLVLWFVYMLWPRVLPPVAPPAASPIVSPVRMAVGGTLVLMPLMVVFLMFGLTDALVVLLNSMILALNFDACAGARQGISRLISNVFGGGLGAAAFLLLGIAPSLVTLGLIVFLLAMTYAVRIDKGGAAAAGALVACNGSLAILSSAIASPPSSSGIWMTRLFQFVLAGLFATGMMALIWGKRKPAERKVAGSAARTSA